MKNIKWINTLVLAGTVAMSSLSAQVNQEEFQGYLVGEEVMNQSQLQAPIQETANVSENAAPSRPSSRFDDVDDFQFGKKGKHPGYGHGHGNGHGHHHGIHGAKRKMMHATRSLMSMVNSNQIQFTNFQSRNYFSVSVNNISAAAYRLDHSWQSKSHTLRVLDDNIRYIQYLRRDGYLRFWDDFGRQDFRRQMEHLREARQALQYR